LKYSRFAAMRRIHAARCIARFPRVARLLRSGQLTLTSASMIAGIITRENADEIISCAVNRSSRELELLVSRHRPELLLRDRVRAVSAMVPEVINNTSPRFPGAGKNSSQPVDNKPDKNRGLSEKPRGLGGGGVDTATESFDIGSGVGDGTAPAAGPAAVGSGIGSAAASASGKVKGSERVESKSPAAYGQDSEKPERVRIAPKYKLEFAVDPEFMEKLAKCGLFYRRNTRRGWTSRQSLIFS
jgi:hypothetical protein